MAGHPATATKVTVTFPLGHGKPYAATEPDDTKVGAIRAAAMTHFGVHEEPGSRYYLTGEPHDRELGDDETIGTVAGKAAAVKLTLAKELIQG